jgi:BASS family bile acid:Na+ symporter
LPGIAAPINRLGRLMTAISPAGEENHARWMALDRWTWHMGSFRPAAPGYDHPPMTSFLPLLNRALSFLGRNGTVFFALSIFLGLALPQLAHSMRPMLAVSTFVFIMLNFARTDADDLRATLTRPGRFTLAFIWIMAAPPLLLFSSFLVVPRAAWNPELLLAITLYVSAPALMGSPAYALLLGFRNGMIIALLFLTTVLSPFVVPPLATFLTGADVPINSLELGLRLLLLVGGAILAGLTLRRWAGPQKMISWSQQFDGIGVVCFLLFAIAAMDGVIEASLADPLLMLSLLALSFATFCILQILSLVVMHWLGPNDAFTISLGTSLRNIGMVIAALGYATPKGTYLFFAMTQFPIYMAPLLVSPLARAYRRRMQRLEPQTPAGQAGAA